MAEARKIQIVLIPGLGGDHRMAYPQKDLPFDLITPDLIEMKPAETLPEYARRFGEHLIGGRLIDNTQPLFLAGYSFGSAIALELAPTFQPNGVILIGGLVSGGELRPIVRYFGLHFVRHIPLIAFTLATPVIRKFMRRNSEVPERDLDSCMVMYKDFSRNLFRAAYHAVAHWRLERSDIPSSRPFTIPILRIHGECDQIITCPTANSNDNEDLLIILGAKHLINFARREAVNRAIENFIDRTMQDTA
ncbi:MAG: alpha/beta hydrolase [Bacteroidota bacterium]|nr:alpha/beta hydrolase [Bacteroidota bacterium]MDP4242639.1 alpha/beta hydrolase [Bacteroidota bacterium]MDP4286799.1 alpha/beta hydrolase [Bacteroidota bacterium]